MASTRKSKIENLSIPFQILIVLFTCCYNSFSFYRFRSRFLFKIQVQYSFFQGFIRNLTPDIFFHHQACNRSSIGCAITSIFNKNSNCNLRIILWCKSNKYRVIFSMRILSSPGLSAYNNILNGCRNSSSPDNYTFKTLDYCFKILSRNIDIMTCCVLWIYSADPYLLLLPYEEYKNNPCWQLLQS